MTRFHICALSFSCVSPPYEANNQRQKSCKETFEVSLTRTGQNGCPVTESIDSQRGGTPVTPCDLYIAVQVNTHFHLNKFQEDTWLELALVWGSWQCWAVMRRWLNLRQSLTADPQFASVMYISSKNCLFLSLGFLKWSCPFKYNSIMQYE